MKCKTRLSVREGSFFAKSKLPLQKWLMLHHFWARQNPVSDTAECAKVAPNSAVYVYQWLREVCSTRLINDGPVILGGPGVIVQIDESLFKHKPKILIAKVKLLGSYTFLLCNTTEVGVPTMNIYALWDTYHMPPSQTWSIPLNTAPMNL